MPTLVRPWSRHDRGPMPLLPVTMLLKIVLFNPMTLCFGRDAEVSTVLSRFDVIGCPGSRAMQYEKTDTVLLKELDFHWAFEFPRLRVPERSQRVIAAHTGCTILLNKRRFGPSQVIRCFYPQLVKDKLIVGRVGGIRVQSGLHDFCSLSCTSRCHRTPSLLLSC